jgi:DNA-binding NarL/FixJ family response regulator
VFSDVQDRVAIPGILEPGAWKYIPMSSELDVAIAAIKLVKAAGTFVPLLDQIVTWAVGVPVPAGDEGSHPGKVQFTERQLDVIDRLRKGESNKTIAYKLDMAQCTVKVYSAITSCASSRRVIV